MNMRNEPRRTIADFNGAGRVCGDAPDPVLDKVHCLPCHETERTEDLYALIPAADVPVELQDKVHTWRCYQGKDGGPPGGRYDVEVRPARVLDDSRLGAELGVELGVVKPPGYREDCDCSQCREYRKAVDS